MIARSSAKCLALLACLGVFAACQAGIASAHTGEFARFNNCPSTATGVFKCIYSVTGSGEVVLGSKTVPIVNAVTLQGGYTKSNPETHTATFIGATNGKTLSETPQPVPGGLAGLVNCKKIENVLVRISCEVFFENGFTGLNATLELAKPASEIQISERNLLFAEGTALKLPVRVHLENPFLGSECYVGSSGSPLIWNLTTGTTAPPAPNGPITGSPGVFEPIEEALIVRNSGTTFVDNAWSAPGASGCGGPFVELFLDPVIDLAAGVPAKAGHNTAVLNATNWLATASAVNAH